MVKALIFDVSGVLSHAKFSHVFEAFAHQIGLPNDLIANYFKDSLEDQLLGHGNLHDMYAGLMSYLPSTNEEAFQKLLVKIITEETTVNTELLTWIDTWRKSYTCGILTNNTEGRGIFDESIALHSHFDFVLESYKEHIKKPDPKFFMLGIEKAGCRAEEIIYVDDQQRHVDAATNIGIQGILFTDNASFLDELQKRLNV